MFDLILCKASRTTFKFHVYTVLKMIIILNTLRKSKSEVSFNSFQHIDGYIGDSLTNAVLQVNLGRSL